MTLGLKEGYLEILECLCNATQTIKTIKGFQISLNFKEAYDYCQFPVEKVRELLGRYPGIRNLNIVLSNGTESVEFIKLDGEKEQFFVNPYSYTPF